jgi:hypothetical protein
VSHFNQSFDEADLRIVIHLVEAQVTGSACLLDDLLRVGRYGD